MAALQDYSETRMRAAIAEVPDGVYEGEDFLDDDGTDEGDRKRRAHGGGKKERRERRCVA